jgi:hypothetical protein
VKRLATLMLLLGVLVGMSALPLQANAAPMAGMSMAKMTQADMSAMPDCVASRAKDAKQKPCKCGMGGCLAMMASGASFMLADGASASFHAVSGKRLVHASVTATLHGRSTTPEPEPPTLLG